MTSAPPRRQLLAAVLPGAAALLITGEALTPKGLDKPITTNSTALRELPIAAAHSGQLYVSNLLVIFGLGALAVAFCAIATLPRDRGRALATTAAVIGTVAGFCGALVNVLIGFNLAAAATADITTNAAAKVLVTANTSAVAHALFAGYLGGLGVATILIIVALWRSRAVTRWLAVLFGVGLIAAAAAPPGPVAIALSLPFAAAMVLLAARLWAPSTAPMHEGIASSLRVPVPA